MIKDKVKLSLKTIILLPLIAAIYILSGCGGGDGHPDWTPGLNELDGLTYTRPVDDDIPLGDYNFTFVSNILKATESGNEVNFTYVEHSKTSATFTFDLPTGTITDVLTFTDHGVGTFVSTTDNDTVVGSFTISTPAP